MKIHRREAKLAAHATALRQRSRAAGFTLVELMVALALTLIVVVFASAALLVARRGAATVDAVSQLQDNARFATDMIQRLTAQVGYLDTDNAVETDGGAFVVAGAVVAEPFVHGYDDAVDLVGEVAINGSRSTGCSASAGTACDNGSDILVLRSQASPRTPGAKSTDGTMLDCMGNSIDLVPASRNDMGISILHLRVGSDGEPSLMCSVGNSTSGKTTMTGSNQPIVQGVENFQVLYGVDGALPNVRPTGTGDAVAERYLRASQMVVPGDDEGTRMNWQRVRSLRIGLVLRGPPNSAQDRTVRPTLYPFGEALASPDDVGTRFMPSMDGRLRQALSFTVYLHNRQQS